jgi:transposase
MTGRPSRLPERVVVWIRKNLKQRKQGWITQQVHEMIVKEGNVNYDQTYIYLLLHSWGFKRAKK